MQRTFIREIPDVITENQIIVDIPRYEVPLARAFFRRDAADSKRFLYDNESLSVITTLGQIKTFVDELFFLDEKINSNIRIPFTNFVGLQFNKTSDAVKWARSFVKRYYPDTETRLLKKHLLNIPIDKTEIIWVGDDQYLNFIKAVAISPTTESMIEASDGEVKQPLTLGEASRIRQEIAEKRKKKQENK